MGFSPAWLQMREPADRRARDGMLMAEAVRAAGKQPCMADLGCGTGATVRAMEGSLPPDAAWKMIDADPELLDLAVPALAANRTAHHHDLADLDRLPLDGVTLVTATALLDLASGEWIGALARKLAARSLPFYAALSYDGNMEWHPRMAEDDAVTRAFNQHQRQEKGLGPAAGPDAAAEAERRFSDFGFAVRIAPSPWRLGDGDQPLMRLLLQGIADAADEAGCAAARGWLDARLGVISATRCSIGHVDMLALPPGHGEDEGGTDAAH